MMRHRYVPMTRMQRVQNYINRKIVAAAEWAMIAGVIAFCLFIAAVPILWFGGWIALLWVAVMKLASL